MDKKIPVVDQGKCTGCGSCVALCGDVFEIQEDGKSHVVDPEGCSSCDCQAAIDGCPVQAIAWKK